MSDAMDRWMQEILVDRTLSVWEALVYGLTDRRYEKVYFVMPNTRIDLNNAQACRQQLIIMDIDMFQQTGNSMFEYPDTIVYRGVAAQDGRVITRYSRFSVDDAMKLHIDMQIYQDSQNLRFVLDPIPASSWEYAFMEQLYLFDDRTPYLSFVPRQVVPDAISLMDDHSFDKLMNMSKLTARTRRDTYIDAMFDGRASMWAYFPMFDERINEDISLIFQSTVRMMDRFLFVFDDKPMPNDGRLDGDQLVNQFTKARHAFEDGYGLALDFRNGTQLNYVLLMDRCDLDAKMIRRTLFVVTPDAVQVVVRNMDWFELTDLEPVFAFDPRRINRVTNPNLSSLTLRLSRNVIQHVIKDVRNWLMLKQGNVLIALMYSPQARVLDESIVWNMALPNNVMDESEKTMMMLLYGAYYGEQQFEPVFKPASMTPGKWYAYVWQNTMIVAQFEQKTPYERTNILDLFIGAPNQPSVANLVFDLGPRPYRLWHRKFMLSRLNYAQSLEQPMNASKLNTVPWETMRKLMQQRPDDPIKNQKAMQGLQRLSGAGWVHVKRNIEHARRGIVLQSRMSCLPSWLGQVAMDVLTFVDQRRVSEKFGSDAYVNDSIVIGDFDRVECTNPWNAQALQQAIPSVVRLMNRFAPVVVAWPLYDDLDWPMRIKGLFDDLKLTLSLSNVMNQDMRYMIQEMANLEYYASLRSVNLSHNRLGMRMVSLEDETNVDLDHILSMGGHDGWLLKSPRSLRRHALFLRTIKGRIIGLRFNQGRISWQDVDATMMVEFINQTIQGSTLPWMHDYWLEKDDVYANLLDAARRMDGNLSDMM